MIPVHLENSEDSHRLPQFQVPNVLPACLAWLWPHLWSAAQDAELARSKHIWHSCIWRILIIPIFFHNFRLQMGCLPACLPMTPIHDMLQHEPQNLLDQDTHDMSAFEEFWRIPNRSTISGYNWMWCDACWKSDGKPASSSWDKQGKTVKERVECWGDLQMEEEESESG